MNKGMVYLVGAGPGDVGLMTLRGAELLSRADAVVYDALVSPELLHLAPPSAERVYCGKRAKCHTIPQEELVAILVSRAKAGQCVVRLKGGDPYIFGRGGEEAEGLATAGVPFEVVPGVSSLAAVPNYAGIPLTHRGYASALTVVTGHGDPAGGGGDINWTQLARMPGTKVIMMGTDRIRAIAEALTRNGLDPATPVAMVSWGTTGRQQSVEGTLATIGDVAEQAHLPPPSVTVIGEVVRLRSKLNWFENKPLFGQRVVVTRSREQAGQLSRRLRESGAEVIEVPTIKIVPPTQAEPLREAMKGLNSYDWLVFTSPNGVNAFFEHFFKRFQDLRDLGGARLATVGPATAAKLQELHLQVDLMPDEHVSTRIVDALEESGSLENLRLLLLRAEVATPELPRLLEEKGAIVDDIACYRTVPETEDPTGSAARLAEEGADWITFTSASTVENLHARFPLPALLQKHPGIRLASIGSETTKALASLGLTPAVQAKVHTIDGLVEALERSVKPRVRGQSIVLTTTPLPSMRSPKKHDTID